MLAHLFPACGTYLLQLHLPILVLYQLVVLSACIAFITYLLSVAFLGCGIAPTLFLFTIFLLNCGLLQLLPWH